MDERVLPELESADGDVRVTWAHPPQHLLPPCLRVETHQDGDRVAVVVSGELDIDTEQALQDALREAVRRSVGGVDVDLGGVDFCDCSGLNVLLSARSQALADAKTLTLGPTGPSVDRLLSLTGTRTLFDNAPTAGTAAGDGQDGPLQRHGPPRGEEPPKDPDLDANIAPDLAPDRDLDPASERDLHIELVQLRRAMQTRPVIDLARGVLMASFALTAQDAWDILVTVSQKTNTKLHNVAEDLVAAVNGDVPSDPLRLELAAAVTALKEPSNARPAD
ncbi:anti-sigma factor antagonist [Streptomyces sp. Ru72]|uniref:anti-sigma factor antagonist n=1 Tax=Streptomyces sp. Ru72 TaxID=2080747 RepID=UPI000CDDB472|nr:anti-sigma factor antagonist [Streptomyces sp. Ru72]POX51934.1 antitermination regulator [Streptomyces sp. Ru72]